MSERFPAAVADALTEAGWTDGRDADELGEQAVAYVEYQVGRDGARLTAFPAAQDALREFVGICVIQDGAGRDLRRRPFLLDPTQVAATTETLADFGAVLSTRLFPLGMEGDHDSVLAVAEDGHVYALDHGGEWHLGDSVDDALVTLVTGAQPPRVDADGHWA